MTAAQALPGIERHPHARALLAAALPPAQASHAYLFAGPAGAGKTAVARAFAAELIADGAPAESHAAERALRGTHPDLTWVAPSGASEMLVSDIDEAVVAAATRTPFESRRRVFVIEAADTMRESTANRMLKTLEEPPDFVHLILLTARPGEVLQTVASRCQIVRFEAPSPERIAGELVALGAEPQAAGACARLALGDAKRGAALALGDGPRLRAAAELYAGAAIADKLDARPWEALLELAKRASSDAESELDAVHAQELELLGSGERSRSDREHTERKQRASRRGAQATLDLALATAGLYYRDAAVLALGAAGLVYATDRREQLAGLAAGQPSKRLQRAVVLVEDAREALRLNATADLALESLAYRIAALP